MTSALGSHVDLAATICALAGVGTRRPASTVQGTDLVPVLADPAASVRDHILFAQDSAQTTELNKVRYALRGFYDGRTKYARYYGVGGGKPSTGLWGKSPGHKLFDVDCAFDDNDHEWYDHDTDPDELVNLANDRSRRGRAARRLRADARLRAGVVRHVRLNTPARRPTAHGGGRRGAGPVLSAAWRRRQTKPRPVGCGHGGDRGVPVSRVR